MKQLFTEILTEIPKLEDSSYCGLFVVHPDDIKKVIDFITYEVYNHCGIEALVDEDYRYIVVNGRIHIGTTENDNWQFNHAGMQYATVLIDLGAFEKLIFDPDGNYIDSVFVNKNNKDRGFEFGYMTSRLRSNSKYNPRMVIC